MRSRSQLTHGLGPRMWRALFGLVAGRRLPVKKGTIEVPGLRAPVSVARDAYGIPYIAAESDWDAWFALGFCQGQDRAFQLEGLLRAVRGTLSEMVGPAGVGIDRLARRLGFHRAAARQMDVIDADVRAALEAFAAGVTEGARGGASRRPHEFSLLRITPTPYEATDVLGISKAMGLVLSANWDLELARLKVLCEDGPAALSALHPFYAREPQVDLPDPEAIGRAIDRLSDDLASFVGRGGASNNWALSGARTRSGRPLVANDIHLEPVLPNYFYLAHVRTPRWGVVGGVLAGTPVVVVGHNGAIAWGITAGLVDNTDLFVQEIGPGAASVRMGDGFAACPVLTERIEVRGGQPITEHVVVTEHGPVMATDPVGGRFGISMRATWLEPRPMAGLFRAHRARTCAQLRAEMRAWPSVSLNVVAADDSGSIAYQLIGDVPRRRKGHGTVPLAAWDTAAGWLEEPAAFDTLPHRADPPSGFLCTANNEPSVETATFLGADWIDVYRAERVTEVLRSRWDWDVTAAAALQMDVECLPWRELEPILRSVSCRTPDARRARALLESWDGCLGAASTGASVFELFVAEMMRRVVTSKAARSMEWGLGKGVTPVTSFSAMGLRHAGFLVDLLNEQPPGWFERPWSEEIADALGAAVGRLRLRWGNSPSRWAWGRIRPLRFRHPVGARRPLDRVFERGPLAWGGDANTVSQAAAPPLDPTANPLLVATLRMVVEVGDWDRARFVLAGGQSGNPLSPHYSDLLPLWSRGEGVYVPWSQGAVERATRTSLELRPLSSRS